MTEWTPTFQLSVRFGRVRAPDASTALVGTWQWSLYPGEAHLVVRGEANLTGLDRYLLTRVRRYEPAVVSPGGSLTRHRLVAHPPHQVVLRRRRPPTSAGEAGRSGQRRSRETHHLSTRQAAHVRERQQVLSRCGWYRIRGDCPPPQAVSASAAANAAFAAVPVV